MGVVCIWKYNNVSYSHVWATSWQLVQAIVLQKVLETLGWIEYGETHLGLNSDARFSQSDEGTEEKE